MLVTFVTFGTTCQNMLKYFVVMLICQNIILYIFYMFISLCSLLVYPCLSWNTFVQLIPLEYAVQMLQCSCLIVLVQLIVTTQVSVEPLHILGLLGLYRYYMGLYIIFYLHIYLGITLSLSLSLSLSLESLTLNINVPINWHAQVKTQQRTIK